MRQSFFKQILEDANLTRMMVLVLAKACLQEKGQATLSEIEDYVKKFSTHPSVRRNTDSMLVQLLMRTLIEDGVVIEVESMIYKLTPPRDIDSDWRV